MSTTLQNLIYNQIWVLLEQGYFASAVLPANRIKLNFSSVTPGSTQQVPVQWTAPEADSQTPQASLLLGEMRHSGKNQSPRLGDNRGISAQGRIRVLVQTFELIVVHRGMDVGTNTALETAVIDQLEAANTGLGLLPLAGVIMLSMEEITARTETGQWAAGSTLRSRTTFSIPVKATFIGNTTPVF